MTPLYFIVYNYQDGSTAHSIKKNKITEGLAQNFLLDQLFAFSSTYIEHFYF